MAARKDNKGRALRKGEFQRASDGKYVYGYVDPNGVRRYIYSKDLKTLRCHPADYSRAVSADCFTAISPSNSVTLT